LRQDVLVRLDRSSVGFCHPGNITFQDISSNTEKTVPAFSVAPRVVLVMPLELARQRPLDWARGSGCKNRDCRQ
jgi:hypothetical protein